MDKINNFLKEFSMTGAFRPLELQSSRINDFCNRIRNENDLVRAQAAAADRATSLACPHGNGSASVDATEAADVVHSAMLGEVRLAQAQGNQRQVKVRSGTSTRSGAFP